MAVYIAASAEGLDQSRARWMEVLGDSENASRARFIKSTKCTMLQQGT
jgi:hypothetical protein